MCASRWEPLWFGVAGCGFSTGVARECPLQAARGAGISYPCVQLTDSPRDWVLKYHPHDSPTRRVGGSEDLHVSCAKGIQVSIHHRKNWLVSSIRWALTRMIPPSQGARYFLDRLFAHMILQDVPAKVPTVNGDFSPPPMSSRARTHFAPGICPPRVWRDTRPSLPSGISSVSSVLRLASAEAKPQT